jgi:hypothetical protein
MTAFSSRTDTSTLANPDIQFGSPNGPPESAYELTDRDLVRRVKDELIAL